MLDSKIGYIICESAPTEAKESVIVDRKNGKVVIETVLQDADTKNRNGRFYASEDLFPACKAARLTELMENRSLLGEASHPMSSELVRQQTIDLGRVSHEIMQLKTDGKYIKGIVKGTPTKFGEEFNNFILEGMKPAFSLRALGSISNTKRGAEVKNISIITWDWVIYPSHKCAYMEKIVSESTRITDTMSTLKESAAYMENDKGVIVPITNSSVMSYIKSESANINTVLKSFDTLYESASLIENGSKVQLMTNTGDIMVVNLESYIQNEIMDYCYR